MVLPVGQNGDIGHMSELTFEFRMQTALLSTRDAQLEPRAAWVLQATQYSHLSHLKELERGHTHSVPSELSRHEAHASGEVVAAQRGPEAVDAVGRGWHTAGPPCVLTQSQRGNPTPH